MNRTWGHYEAPRAPLKKVSEGDTKVSEGFRRWSLSRSPSRYSPDSPISCLPTCNLALSATNQKYPEYFLIFYSEYICPGISRNAKEHPSLIIKCFFWSSQVWSEKGLMAKMWKIICIVGHLRFNQLLPLFSFLTDTTVCLLINLILYMEYNL